MRELLFRGQTRRKGEKVRLDGTPIDSNWVYGGVAQLNEERAMIYQTEPNFQKFAVYADTVGQYTGLTDDNGKKIFEGDIVKVLYSDTVGEMHKTTTVVDDIRTTSVIGWLEYADELEIIGNIHDNGELLKGE